MRFRVLYPLYGISYNNYKTLGQTMEYFKISQEYPEDTWGYPMPVTKRVLVTFTPEQWDRIQKVRPEVGLGDADAVRTIVVNWLMEKGYLAQSRRELGGRGQAEEDNR